MSRYETGPAENCIRSIELQLTLKELLYGEMRAGCGLRIKKNIVHD